jgi:hypothetical protein
VRYCSFFVATDAQMDYICASVANLQDNFLSALLFIFLLPQMHRWILSVHLWPIYRTIFKCVTVPFFVATDARIDFIGASVANL